ncbi:hypothetical protein EAH86_19095 [Pedococcus bigeumensis]|uniref:DUF998 domain-containing protein n=1 Tax=Pedococcus bigeumensis TaxID=433644 RepID=A0A502CLE3_9MICO|nr:hypothetical protein EAH86_19095 [Pedococcus bigeumensis]
MKEIPVTTHLDAPATSTATNRSKTRTISQLLPGAAALVYAGVQLDGGIIAAAYRSISTVPDDRLNFPFSGSLATATSLTWGLTQALFVVTLVAFARSGAVGASRPGRIGAWMAVAGSIVYVAAHAVSLTFRDARLDDPAGRVAITLFVLATLLTAVGFILAGVAVARAGCWTAWRRYPVLAVGVWVLCMLPLQFTSLLPLSVAVFAATIAAFAVALLAQPEDRKQ